MLRCLVLAFSLVAGIAPSAHSYTRGTVEDVQRIIKTSIHYYRKHGGEKAFQKFNHDPAPEFFDEDTFIAIATQGEEGIVVVNPDDLESLGTKVKDKQDLRGANIGKAIIKKVAELKAASKKGDGSNPTISPIP